MRLVFISDTHGRHEELNYHIFKDYQEGDMIIHSGDVAHSKDIMTNIKETESFIEWFSFLPHEHKILVPGNHDLAIARNRIPLEDFKEIHLLIHQVKEINNLIFFGSPWTPSFGMDWVYNMKRSKIGRKWKDIPLDADIVITHGPPKGIFDGASSDKSSLLYHDGDKSLLNRVTEVEPLIHAFGHFHSEGDIINNGSLKLSSLSTLFINSSIVDLRNDNVINEPIYYELN